MTSNICTCVFLVLFSFHTISSNFNLQEVDRLIPARSTLQVLGTFNPEHLKSWESKLLKLLLRSRTTLKVVFNLPVNHSLKSSIYYKNCRINQYIFSKYFGHSTTQISVIFLPKVDTHFEKRRLTETRGRLSHCGETPPTFCSF